MIFYDMADNQKIFLINSWLFIFMTIIFYLIISFIAETLVYKEVDFKLEEKNPDKSIQYEIEDDEVLQEVMAEVFPSHGSSNTNQVLAMYNNDVFDTKLVKLCDDYDFLCKKIDMDDEFDSKESFMNHALSVKGIEFINNTAQYWYELWDTLEELTINKDAWARRWTSSRYKVTINTEDIKDYGEYFYVNVHELWHIMDLWALKWNLKEKDKNFTEFWKEVFKLDDPSIEYYKISRESEDTRKKESSKQDFCSGYWMYDPFEDFAECFNMYINHNNTFKKASKDSDYLAEKYNYFANLFDSQYLFDSDSSYEEIQNNKRRRHRDTTRLD